MSVLMLILAGGKGSGLSVLTAQRAKAAVPFGGKYRIIDFALSNAVNSNLHRIAVLAQFQAFSLLEHLGTGEPWCGAHQQPEDGIQVWQPYRGRTDLEMYRGTADAVYQNRKYIAEDGSEMLLVVAGDHLYKQDYREMIRFHKEKGADLTIATMHVPLEVAHGYGIMAVDPDAKITAFDEKPAEPKSTLASLGIYVFNTAYILKMLEEDAQIPNSRYDFGRDIIPNIVAQGRAYAYSFRGYISDINTAEALWKTNLALLDVEPGLDLYAPEWVIHTRSAEKPPARFGEQCKIVNSLISDGCIIEGEVIHSVLSPGVRVERGARVSDSVIMNDTIVHSQAAIESCVIDMEVEVGAGARIGIGENIPNQEEPENLNTGITVVGMRAIIPAGTVVGRNCRIDPDVTPGDYNSLAVDSGKTIHHR